MAGNLEIDLLRTFAAVADCGSFTAAAQLVSRTQSAVSLQVKRLEDILGRRVFERSSRSLQLTPAGTTLLDYARRMLDLNDESLRRVAEPPVHGRFQLGITEYFLPSELPSLLARFRAAYRDVQLDVRMGLSSGLRDAVRAGDLDAALVRLSPGEAGRALWIEPQVWVAGESFEERREEPLPLVLLPQPCVLREHAIESMQRSRRRWHLAFTGSSMASVQAAVRAGLGVSIIPRSSVGSGMRVLSGRPFRNACALHIGLVKSARAPQGIAQVLNQVVGETLSRVAVGRG